MGRNKQRLWGVIFVFIFIMNCMPVSATSGKLKSASIVSCNGSTYGNHGDGHWHYAVKHDAGWYPDGGSLGYDNPCQTPSQPSQPSKQESTPQKSTTNTVDNQAAQKQKEAERLEAERLEAERLEAERLEAERLEAERLEAQRIEEEKIQAQLNDVSYDAIYIDQVRISDESNTLYLLNDLNLRVDTTNSNASFMWEFEKDKALFSENVIVITITSENNKKKKTVKIPCYFLGSQEALNNTPNIELNQEKNPLSKNENNIFVGYPNVNSLEIVINGHQIKTESITLVDKDNNTYVRFVVNGKAYDVQYEKPKVLGPIMGFLGGTAALGAGGYYMIKRKKKHTAS